MSTLSKRIIARNATALLVSEVGIRVFSAIGVVLVARSLGPRAYGVLSVALAFSSIVAYLSDLGLTHLTIQHITAPNADVGCILSTIFKVRLILVAAVTLVSVVGILMLYPEPEQSAVTLAVVLPCICGVAMRGFAASYFWAVQQLHITAAINAASQAFSAMGLILAFFLHWPVVGVGAVYGATSLLGGIACLWLVRRRAPEIGGWNPKALRGLTAFTIGGFAAIALPQLGPLILQQVAAPTQVGYFAAASRIPGLLYAIPSCLGMAWYPQLFAAGSRNTEQHLALSVNQLKINAILSVGLSLPVALYSRLLVRVILGSSWEVSTAPILSLLCWMVVLNGLGTPFGDALTTKGLQRRRAGVSAAALPASAVLFAILGSRSKAMGAAVATIITQMLLGIGLVLVNPSGRAMFFAAGQQFLRPILLGSACALAVRMLLPDNILCAALAVAVFFFVALGSDTELRIMVSRGASGLSARWRYTCPNQ